MKVLVAYYSKTGFTKGMAEFIGEKLRGRGLQADVQDVGSVSNAGDYDAYVIGSAIYMYHWAKEAKQFVSHNQAVLATKPVWLFSSGPVGTKTTNAKGEDLLLMSGPKELDEFREQVKPRGHMVFFGGLDGSKLTGMVGLGYKLAMKSQSAREDMPEGDFRNWKGIEAWANDIADALGGRATTASSFRG